MTQPSSPPPNIPDIQRCPRCNNPILIGDVRCINCGYNVDTVEDMLRRQSPTLVSAVLFGIGLIFTISALTLNDLTQLVFLAIGGGFMLAGSGYTAISIIFFSNTRRRK